MSGDRAFRPGRSSINGAVSSSSVRTICSLEKEPALAEHICPLDAYAAVCKASLLVSHRLVYRQGEATSPRHQKQVYERSIPTPKRLEPRQSPVSPSTGCRGAARWRVADHVVRSMTTTDPLMPPAAHRSTAAVCHTSGAIARVRCG